MRRKIILFAIFLFVFGLAQGQTGHFFTAKSFSSGLISDLCQDKYGNIWIATDYGLNRFDGYQFKTYLHDKDDPGSLATSTIVTLLCDRGGHLWVGTNHGLDRYDPMSDAFVHYTFPAVVQPRISKMVQAADGTIIIGTAGFGAYSIGSDDVPVAFDIDGNEYYSNLFIDSHDRLWNNGFDDEIVMLDNGKIHRFQSTVGTPQSYAEQGDEVLILCFHGLMSYRNGKMQVADIDRNGLSDHDVVFSDIVAAANGDIYVSTRGRGLYRIPAKQRRMERVDVDAYGIDLNTAKIGNMLTDQRGNLWLGCYQKGLLMMPQRPMQFSNWSFEAQGMRLSAPITSVCAGDGDIIWCSVQGVGIYGFNAKGHVVAHPAAPEAVEFIFRDKQDQYWIGTDDGLFSYNPLTGSSQLKVTFDCDKFNDMTSDVDGNIYISTFSRGFCVYNPKTGALRNYNISQGDSVRGRLCNNWIMCMMPDRHGMIWMGTSSGVSCFDPSSQSFRTQGWNWLLDDVMCFSLCELNDGNIAIGTEQGLFLYDRKTRKAERFPDSEQLDNKAVSYIVQSNDGDVWCSSSMGIWQYDSKQKHFIGHVNGGGLTNKEYLYGVGMHTDGDRIFFAHNDGITTFSPRNVKADMPSADELMLTDFLVGNVSINAHTVLNGVKVTDKPLPEAEQFTLSYLDHTITLAFSQLNFDNPMNVTFEYRVNGGEWVSNVEGKNDFTLGHLRPGTYRIEVRALSGDVYSPVKSITVTVRSPWYSTTLAYACYLLALLALVAFIFFTYRRRANQQLNEEKMKFLINTTHDIRSPLTLIMGPLANLKRRLSDAQNADTMRDVNTIEHNAQRILNLVNQILDVRKIDKQQMHLHCQQTDLVSFVNGIFKMYEYNAQERNIKYTFSHEGIDTLDVWIDRSQFDKVVTNLLSNAFKYSYDGGEVEIRLTRDEQQARLQIIDNGVGLDSDNLKHIFDRFYQGSNSRRMHIDGTGIGLNLCKMIVDMHHGTIEAQKRTDARGSVFTVGLLLGTAHLTDAEIEQESQEDAVQPQHAKTQTSRYRVLVVDDDLEIGNYISSELSNYYKITICTNGKEGLKELLARSSGENDYDVVVSDVMMPEMDGFTMLRMIKTNLNISHIPVIMLTSKADVGNRLEGLERGADAFIAKPFDMEELHMTIDNLIQTRQRLKGKFTGAQQQADKLEQPEVKGNDEQLMERIMKVVNKNLSNSDFNVDMLSREVGISRAQLHRKMKELTGIPTSEFIRNIRLEQAARLLKEQKINVTQVAYTVGFSNLAHFSTIFRKHFGVAPSEYAEQAAGAE